MTHPSRGIVLNAVVLVATLSVVTFAAAWPFMAPAIMAPVAVSAALTNTGKLQAALHEAGLSPDNMAAAGWSATQAGAAVAAVRDDFTTLGATLDSARAGLQSARAEHDRLRALVTSGTATDQDITALRTAETTLANAETALANAINAVFTEATSGLATGLVDNITMIHGNRGTGLVAWRRCATRTETNWASVTRAAACERIADNRNEDTPQDAATILLSTDSETAVAAAKVGYDTNLAAVTTAWNDNLTP